MLQCPDFSELEQFLAGRLSQDSSAVIKRHVAGCQTCDRRLSDISGNLNVVAPVRLAFRHLSSEGNGFPCISGYRILRRLGRGGMGVVYLAEQERPRRLVAIKFLHADADARLGARINREYEALGRLVHPGIAQLYGVGGLGRSEGDEGAARRQARPPDGGRVYLVMEYVRGRRLDAYVRDAHPSLQERLELIALICDAVHHAHVKGVIHRDLKPGNILICEDADSPAPKVIDFGVARLLDENRLRISAQTEAGQLLGTFVYMSPQQVTGNANEIDARSDVYAIGVLMYEVLCGRLPYDVSACSLPDLARTIAEVTPLPLAQLDRRLRGDIEAIVMKALAKDPEHRYQSAAEMAADIRRHLRGEPVTARRPSLLYHAVSMARRHRAIVTGAAAAILVLISTTGIALQQASAAARQRDAAERRLAYAQEAANYVLVGVDRQLARVLGAEAVRRHLAEEAYVYHRRLAEELPDAPYVQARYSTAVRRLIQIAFDLDNGRRAEALAELLEEWIHGPAQRLLDDLDVRHEVFLARSDLARVAEMRGDPVGADELRRSAAELRRVPETLDLEALLADAAAWTAEDQGPGAGKSPHAVKLIGLAVLTELEHGRQRRLSGDLPAARDAFGRALDLAGVLLRHDPHCEPMFRREVSAYAPLMPPLLLRASSKPAYEQCRAEALQGLGDIAWKENDPAAARACYDEALAIAERHAAQTPRNPEAIGYLAALQERAAALFRDMHEWSKARRLAQASLDLCQVLSEADPADVHRQQSVLRGRRLLEEIAAEAESAGASLAP